jgi:Sugar-transfer associated ATP-grasp
MPTDGSPMEAVAPALLIRPLVDASKSAVASPRGFGAAKDFLGANSRLAFHELRLFRSARHPPIAAAFYPGFQEAIVVAAIAWLLVVAGLPVKRATGKSIASQAREMLSLWFRQRIDPPSYYAQDLYKPEQLKKAARYLTRYETKNGLLKTLNAMRSNPFTGNEMNDKALFSEVCSRAGIAHAPTLARAERGTVQWLTAKEEIAFDLFCKRRNGMGAKSTMTLRHAGPNRFVATDGRVMNLNEIESCLSIASRKHPMLVQRRLRNDASLCDLAKDSLLAVRVITCLNAQDEPEVCLAMLRVLAVLEPEWRSLPDGEYAAPIDLASGRLGRLTGDNMRTAPIRMDFHPATAARITGRTLAQWPDIASLARRAHRAVPHRLILGWDIASTDDGPIALEGNTNFDVMFLQRVHDAPASESRFGELMNFHLENLVAQRSSTMRSNFDS